MNKGKSRIPYLREQIRREITEEDAYIQQYDLQVPLSTGTVITDSMMVGYLRILLQEKNRLLDDLLNGCEVLLGMLDEHCLDKEQKQRIQEFLSLLEVNT